MKKTVLLLLSTALLSFSTFHASAADYVIDDDSQGAHAFINFKIKHLGYSWLTGRFNTFSGKFTYDDKNPNASTIVVDIDPASVDSNHAERDKHLRGKDFLHVSKYKDAKFVSTTVTDKGDGALEIIGDLTLHGVTKSITIDAKKIGEGQDPWGGYRAGFSGETVLLLKDFGIDYNLGPASTQVNMELHIEGIRQ